MTIMQMKYFLILFSLFVVSCAPGEEKISRKAERMHDGFLSIDTHCDTPMRFFRRGGFDPGVRNEQGCVDFPRMKEGRLDAEFFAIFIGQGPRTPEAYELAHNSTLATFDSIYATLARNSSQAAIALTPDDALRHKADGRLAIFIGIENSYPAGRDLSKIQQYYDLGARYITLCHSSNNDICDSSTDKSGPEHNGLSAFGEQVVKEMNRVGMMIDVSHISDESFYDVLALSEAPVIASHSSCRALCESPRNLNDEMLQALKKNGGVIQICILSDYLRQPAPNPEYEEKVKELRERWRALGTELTDEQQEQRWAEFSELKSKYVRLATVADAVNHIQHVIDVIGIDHVGIGSDFDGGGGLEDCSDVSMMKNITRELIRRGYSRDEIAKIWGGNIMRVMREAQDQSAVGSRQ